jgi:hypothetical protein
MTGSRAAVVALPADTQILITRDFDAPRHLEYGDSLQQAMDRLEQAAISARLFYPKGPLWPGSSIWRSRRSTAT